MNRCRNLLTGLFLLLSTNLYAQTDALRHNIEQVIATKKATVGVGIWGLATNDTLSINGRRHFPMQSVFKFHIALAVLDEVDKGTLSLTQKLHIPKSDLLPNTWSPLREAYPDGTNSLSLADILKYTVSQSDNNGCDILLKLVGGPTTVDKYIHRIGIKEVAIEVNEAEMHQDWNIQYRNWTTPLAAVSLLKTFYDRKILTKTSADFLWKIMLETSTGANRIKGALPAGTLVAHKTGLSDTNAQGLTAAVNDIGIVVLPDGKQFAISVFVSESMENDATNAKIIADVSKLAWDYFINSSK